ncbi:MAG TPA: type I DNA topoisomerase, partial [Proteobacteria bacterium]|nr:type I DNA topoisomerase [Pseudomonadota bacterium]
MADSLIIVESPTKARTIKRFVGKRFEVAASNGHIKDLPARELGVRIDKGFEPKYQTIPSKRKIVAQLKKMAEGKSKIYLASDPDREGEAIAWHIAELLKGKNREFLRLLIHEITRDGIEQALKNPAHLDKNRYESQIARRVLDRLVGYKISPLLWNSLKSGLSAGRVQSVALRLIVDREKEIRKFVPKEFWDVRVRLQAEKPPEFWAKLTKKDGKELVIPNEAEAKRVETELRAQRFVVERVDRKERRKSPPAPFITSTLQQEAYRRFRFPARHTMRIAQELYEGIEVGDEGQIGLITYMRTDSVRVAESAVSAVRKLIQTEFGSEYLPSKPRTYRSRKLAQEAHEAIRPTRLDLAPKKIEKYLSKDQFKLYDLIYKRFVASQMKDARIDETTIVVSAGPYELVAKGQKLVFNGFLAVYQESREPEENGEDREAAAALPGVARGEQLKPQRFELKRKFTKPKPRYTESSLIRELEASGIGRPSTYATIVGTLFDREYVRREKGYLIPTRLGELVSDMLVATFPEIMDVNFTAKMEEELDEVEEGKKG